MDATTVLGRVVGFRETDRGIEIDYVLTPEGERYKAELEQRIRDENLEIFKREADTPLEFDRNSRMERT